MASRSKGDSLEGATEALNQRAHAQDVARIRRLVSERQRRDGRSIIGIAGPPAAGKSTLADALVRALNRDVEGPVPHAALLPMDGYHLDNRVLAPRGLLARKGAPETFDAHGFCAEVRGLASATRETFHPVFDRTLDLAIANAIAIHPETRVIVVEGNYLLLKSAPWASLRAVFAATVFIAPPIEELRLRLMSRWVGSGLDPGAAEARVTGNDLPNARLILRESFEPDLRLTA